MQCYGVHLFCGHLCHLHPDKHTHFLTLSSILVLAKVSIGFPSILTHLSLPTRNKETPSTSGVAGSYTVTDFTKTNKNHTPNRSCLQGDLPKMRMRDLKLTENTSAETATWFPSIANCNDCTRGPSPTSTLSLKKKN